MNRDVLNLKETADFLRVSIPTLKKHITAIPHRTIGHRYLFSRQALIDWLAEKGTIESPLQAGPTERSK